MKQTVQVESPAQAGRRQRIKEFKQFIEANRKSKTALQIVAVYGIETGIRQFTLNQYLKLFYDAGIYHKPTRISEHKLLTPSEYEETRKEHNKRMEEEMQRRKEINPYDLLKS